MKSLVTSCLLSLLLLGAAAVHGQKVPRAVPVNEEAPIPKAIPVSPQSATAEKKPKGPDEDLFEYASMVYERQEYGLATESFAKYLQNYPSGSHVPVALFRIGECYMKQNQLKVAETYYTEVVNRYPTSEGAPSAAYRLGAMRFNVKDFEQSANYFAFCETKSPLPQVRLAASFNKARAYQMMGDTKRQMAALNAVIAVKTDNPYRESALMTMGTGLLAEDKKAEALPLFLDLIQVSKDKAVVSEASVKAAVLQAEGGKPEDAIPLFQKALDMPETTPANRSIALVGVVQSLFAKGDYDGVIANYTANATILPGGDTRPKMLLLVGNAYRMKKSYARAVEVYLMIEEAHKDTDQAFEAGYWKLYCFYLLDDKDLADFATAFIQRNAVQRANHEFLNLARLIRADYYFNKQDYAKAADSFNEVKIDQLPEKLRPGTLFNQGWAQSEAQRRPEAIASFTKFTQEFPAHEMVPKAVVRRGLVYREAGDLIKAMKDFQRVVTQYLHSDAAEMAYLQMGLIAMEQRDSKAMIAAFEMLVQKYPASQAAGQAWYGIGRGYFDLKQWDKAVPALRRSIEVDKKTYLDRANQMLILAFYAQQDVEGLSKTIDDFRASNANASIQPNVLTWLGLKLFDMKLFARSTKYLALAATPDVPENTDPRVWNYLGMAFLETKDYESSINAANHFLAVTPESAAKARGLLTKGRALLGLGKFDEAESVVQEGLQFAKDGKPQALLLILEGDIIYAVGEKYAAENKAAAAKQRYAAAASKYMIPAQFFIDDEVTPEALAKAAKALDGAGQTAKAEEFRKTLKEKYPKYQAQ
ncbi:MAG: tetratricopeptide repeat protein [Prosthecobacter sp.]|nr:tetratricopeptide repeat protein [Prosthecobacter sp.]